MLTIDQITKTKILKQATEGGHEECFSTIKKDSSPSISIVLNSNQGNKPKFILKHVELESGDVVIQQIKNK